MLRLDICNVTLSRSTSISAFIQMPLLWVQLQQVGQGLEFRTKSFQKMVVRLKQKKYCKRRNIFSCFRDILKPMSRGLFKKDFKWHTADVPVTVVVVENLQYQETFLSDTFRQPRQSPSHLQRKWIFIVLRNCCNSLLNTKSCLQSIWIVTRLCHPILLSKSASYFQGFHEKVWIRCMFWQYRHEASQTRTVFHFSLVFASQVWECDLLKTLDYLILWLKHFSSLNFSIFFWAFC